MKTDHTQPETHLFIHANFYSYFLHRKHQRISIHLDLSNCKQCLSQYDGSFSLPETTPLKFQRDAFLTNFSRWATFCMSADISKCFEECYLLWHLHWQAKCIKAILNEWMARQIFHGQTWFKCQTYT